MQQKFAILVVHFGDIKNVHDLVQLSLNPFPKPPASHKTELQPLNNNSLISPTARGIVYFVFILSREPTHSEYLV